MTAGLWPSRSGAEGCLDIQRYHLQCCHHCLCEGPSLAAALWPFRVDAEGRLVPNDITYSVASSACERGPL